MAFGQRGPILHDRHLDAQLAQERIHVSLMLALVRQGVREDVGRAVHERLAVGVHLVRRHQFVVTERVEVPAGMIAHAAPEGLELVPRRHAIQRLGG